MLNVFSTKMLNKRNTKLFEQYQRKGEVLRKRVGNKHPDLIPFYEAMSKDYRRVAEHRAALAALEEIIEILTGHLTSIHTHLVPYYLEIIDLTKESKLGNSQIGYLDKAFEIHQIIPTNFHQKIIDGYENNIVSFHKIDMIEDCSNKLAILYELETSPENINLIRYYSTLTRCKWGKNEDERVISYHKEIIRLVKLHYGNSSAELIKPYNDFGVKYLKIYNIELAKKLFQKAIDLQNIVSKPNNLLLIDSYLNMGSLFDRWNERKKSLDYRLKALKLQKQYSEIHPNIVENLLSIGVTYKALKQYDKSIEFGLKAVKILKDSNEKHCDLSALYYDIGQSYEVKKDYQKMVFYHQKGIQVEIDLNGEYSSNLIGKYNKLGNAYCKLQYHQNAIDSWKKAMEITETIFKSQPLFCYEYYPKLATSYLLSGQLELALEYWQKTIYWWGAGNKKEYKLKHIYYQNWAATYFQLENYEQAVEKMKKSVAICEQFLAHNEPLIQQKKEVLQFMVNALEKSKK